MYKRSRWLADDGIAILNVFLCVVTPNRKQGGDAPSVRVEKKRGGTLLCLGKYNMATLFQR